MSSYSSLDLPWESFSTISTTAHPESDTEEKTLMADSGMTESPSHPSVPVSDSLDLLLIGKTGAGKSATGNTIIGQEVFKSSFSVNSVTKDVSSSVAKVKGRIIKVVDGPGVGSTEMEIDKGIEHFVESMVTAIAMNPEGYHAFLIVLKVVDRFSKEDSNTIAFLKKVFGDDFVKKYCILVMTFGDEFKRKTKKNQIDFTQWLQQQTGPLADLVEECQHRIVLFDNETENLEEKSAQRDKLLEAIDTLNNNGKRYTDANFQTAFEAREKVIAEYKVPIVGDKTMEAITLLLQELEEIRGRASEIDDITTTQNITNDLQRLLKSAEALKKDVVEQDKGTKALKNLIQSVEMAEKVIASSLELHQLALKSRLEHQETETEMSSLVKELEDQIKNAKTEDERKRLMEENQKLQMKMLALEKEINEAPLRYQESHTMAWSEFDRCQSQVYGYKKEREHLILEALLQFFIVVTRPLKKLFKLLRSNYSLTTSYMQAYEPL